MLTIEQIEHVRRLLSERRSQREIHLLTKLARGTIARIAHGRRPACEAIGGMRREPTRTRPRGPRRRCPGCGHLVRLPCRICRARRWKLISLVWNGPEPVPDLEEPLGLELEPEDQARYEEILARRGLALRQATIQTSSRTAPGSLRPKIPRRTPNGGGRKNRLE